MAEPGRLPAESRLPVSLWRAQVIDHVAAGGRFAGLYGTDRHGATEVTALLAEPDGFRTVGAVLEPGDDGVTRYPTLSVPVPAAFWYERALHDLSGVVPDGHPRLDPLLLPVTSGQERPRPGRTTPAPPVHARDERGPVDITGHIFTLPFGPVRSGVTESIELLLETPGEDIPHLTIRPHFKHRGIAKRFEQLTVQDGVLVAERVEGISSVAHALAFAHAVEAIGSVRVPQDARLLRVVHAELERLANHLDVTLRLCDAAGLAVATARFGWHKERVMRLVSRMCGSRFGRGVVVPGGVAGAPAVPAQQVAAELTAIGRGVTGDVAALEGSASFLDRLRGTGPLAAELAARHGALGPVGRASGFDDDDRRLRSYDAYPELPAIDPPRTDTGDALARARVRWHEIGTSIALITAALDRLDVAGSVLRAEVPVTDGFALGWSEAAQGEALYALEIQDGRIRRCLARSASLHNLVLFHDVFDGDIFTDLPFIEASFGLSYAGVAM